MGIETAVGLAVFAGGAYGGYKMSKKDKGKSAAELKGEAADAAREKSIKRARAKERNKTVFTSLDGAAGLKKKLGE